MSYWGARTGYAYESQRVSFLREIYKTERRHRELSLSPRVNPGMAALTASMAASPALASPERVYNPHPPLESVPSPPPVAPASVKTNWPAVSTQSQVQFRPHDTEFLARFRAGKEHARPNDKETMYREQVFQIWNITGTKSPAVFR